MPTSETPQALIQQLSANKDPAVADFARNLAGFIESGDLVWLGRVGAPPAHGKVGDIGRLAAEAAWPWSEESRRIVEFAARLKLAHPVRGWLTYHALWRGVTQSVLSREQKGDGDAAEWLQARMIEWGFGAGDFVEAISDGCWVSAFASWHHEDEEAKIIHRWESHTLRMPSADLIAALGRGGYQGYFVDALAAERPEVVREWLTNNAPSCDQARALVRGNAEFDSVAVAFVVSSAAPMERALVLDTLMRCRAETHQGLFLRVARDPAVTACAEIMGRLCEVDGDQAVAVLPLVLRGGFMASYGVSMGVEYQRAYALAASRLGGAGDAVFDTIVEISDLNAKIAAIGVLLESDGDERKEPVVAIIRRIVASLDHVDSKVHAHVKMSVHRPAWFLEEWRELLGSSSKQLREAAIDGWKAADPMGGRALAREFLNAKRADQRLGAVALLAEFGNGEDVAFLQAAFSTEKSSSVRTEIRGALEKHGASVSPEVSGEAALGSMGLSELEAALLSQKRKPRAPTAEWLDLTALPALFDRDGAVVGKTVIAHLISTQAARKEIANSFNLDLVPEEQDVGSSGEQLLRVVQTPVSGQRSIQIAPDLLPIYAQIDRARSGDFALALLEAWLGSEQDAKHRWAMTIAGALGDTRILSVLNSWIPKWCEKGRGKLAEYAAQAIALQGSDEALMLLDALANRYRSKQRNIGAAAAQAFQVAATARGLSADELGDVVVPSFGFDADGLRDFNWDGGAARAELGMELKLSWSDPESDKVLKGLPASAPDVLKAEVKELGKLLREAAKGQAARLELALVRQRRWPVARWRELYENHPVLRAYATRLVWGVYRKTATGGEELARCFRRYPNGLLADAAGGLEELPEADSLIGMVHPLELCAEALAAWRAHLARFKVTPPFPQLDRAVERLDPLHANRRELAVAKDRELGAGTFRSRAERRGWQRGSVVDAGGVAGYFKAFPGAGVEVSLDLDGLYIGIDPMDTVTLGAAHFVRADLVKRGSYTYDDPQAGDERVLSFGEVPPVVYSETVGDLKAIAGIVADVAEAENEPA